MFLSREVRVMESHHIFFCVGQGELSQSPLPNAASRPSFHVSVALDVPIPRRTTRLCKWC